MTGSSNESGGGVLALTDERRRSSGNWGRFARAFRRNHIAMVGMAIVLIMVVAALFPGTIATHEPNALDPAARLTGPSNVHYLGTDDFGRDIFSRLVYGARISLLIAFVAQSVAISIGITLGLTAGWFGGTVDDVIMRITDGFFAIPGLLFLIVWVSIFEPSRTSIFLALGLIGWPADARMMRSQVLSVKENEYVVAARAMGASNIRIMMFHLLPNALAPSIVLASLGIAGAILAESSLSFLGLGVEIPNPSWGSMIDAGRNFTTRAWWYSVFPGFAIMITVLGFNFVGDGLRDALDPKLYR
jgi:peptide/nickel transport system permease protein